jgi:hypothetical protein
MTMLLVQVGGASVFERRCMPLSAHGGLAALRVSDSGSHLDGAVQETVYAPNLASTEARVVLWRRTVCGGVNLRNQLDSFMKLPCCCGRAAGAAAIAVSSAAANAIDLTPGELSAPRPGLNVVQVSYQQNTRGARYADGEKVDDNAELAYRYLQLRVGRTFTLRDTPGLFYIDLPAGSVQPGGSLKSLEASKGLADTSLLFALWPYTDRERDRHLVIGGYLILPTGRYRHEQRINLGHNRLGAALQVGYQMALGPSLSWSSAWDVVASGPNDTFGPRKQRLEQALLHTVQTGLNYQLSSRYGVAVNLIHTEGGRTRVDTVLRRDRIDVDRYLLTATAATSYGRFSLQYGRDLRTRNGFLDEGRVLLRYRVSF